MKKRKVISKGNLPTSLPIIRSLTIVLCLDYWNAPAWLWGVLITILSFIWISVFISIYVEDQYDIFTYKK